jgi:hypothetical protein
LACYARDVINDAKIGGRLLEHGRAAPLSAQEQQVLAQEKTG